MSMNLVEAIIKIRQEQGKSDQDIAELLGVDKSLIYKYRKGLVKKISPSTGKKIADILNLKFVEEYGEPHFYQIHDDDPAPPKDAHCQFESIAKQYSDKLGYEATPEGFESFLRECRGQYQTLHNIKRLLSGSQSDEQSSANN